jgi:hypothetical protein
VASGFCCTWQWRGTRRAPTTGSQSLFELFLHFAFGQCRGRTRRGLPFQEPDDASRLQLIRQYSSKTQSEITEYLEIRGHIRTIASALVWFSTANAVIQSDAVTSTLAERNCFPTRAETSRFLTKIHSTGI